MPYRTPDASQYTRYVKCKVSIVSEKYEVPFFKARNSYSFYNICNVLKNIPSNYLISNKFLTPSQPICPLDVIFDGGDASSNFCDLLNGTSSGIVYDAGNASTQVCGV